MTMDTERIKLDEGTTALDNGSREDAVERCIEALVSAGVPSQFCVFYADVIKCEFDMMYTIYRMQKDLKDSIDKEPPNCFFLFVTIQAMTKKFFSWKTCVDSLTERGIAIPPLKLNPDKLASTPTVVKALCSFETTEMELREGEDLVITDATRPDRLRVRNSRGEEGYVPALCCLLPSPDDSATNAVQRLQIHLLTSWTDCVQKVKRILLDNLDAVCKLLTANWSKSSCHLQSNGEDLDRVSRRIRRFQDSIATRQENSVDLNRLHKALIGLERELHSLNCFELNEMIGAVSNLDKAVLCYHLMYKQWRKFRQSLKQSPRPIHLVLHFDRMREMSTAKTFKYYELKMNFDEVGTVEEITYISGQTGESCQVVHPGGGTSSKHETLSTEEMTSSMQEEKKRFVIRSVVDLRDNSEISLQDATSAGIIDPRRGVYVNLSSGKAIAIPLAMSEGLIKVEYVSTRRTAERKEAFGLITIRTQIDNGQYVIAGAVDARTAERLDVEEARRRGILNEDEDWYLVGTTGERLPLIQALDRGWVFATNDADAAEEPRFEVHTYAVSEVRDQANGSTVGFTDAIRRGLIDRDTGDYVNNLTGERVHIVDAIETGALRAKLVDDVAGLNVSLSNSVVVDRIQRVNRRIVKATRVISAFENAGRETRSSPVKDRAND